MSTVKVVNSVSGEEIKTINSADGTQLKNIMGVESAGGDAFANQVNSTSNLAAWWSPNGADGFDGRGR